ncbi:hypothetical protein [Muriicola jejuensis]|uniref:hypothetical protein n=1 Tax=Muriicola jejuensis TaxID=504488 RepID=UPI0013CF6320|nr:hypothetical protein [Muriicola jejuensis]
MDIPQPANLLKVPLCHRVNYDIYQVLFPVLQEGKWVVLTTGIDELGERGSAMGSDGHKIKDHPPSETEEE